MEQDPLFTLNKNSLEFKIPSITNQSSSNQYQTDEIIVNNPVLSDSSIGFTVSTPDYATDDYSNIRK